MAGAKPVAKLMRLYAQAEIPAGGEAAGSLTSALAGPAPRTRQIVKIMAKMLPENHLSRHPLDDEISRRCLTLFLKALDPMKMYFNRADVDGFMKRQNDLDDLAKAGEMGFAYEVFNVLLERVNQRVKLINELLGADQDLTVDETMLTDSDAATYPENDLEAREIWRKRIKYETLVLEAEGTAGDEVRERLSRRYNGFLKRMHQTSDEELLEMYLTAMAHAYDPNSSFLSAVTLENFSISSRLHLEGIGASLQHVDGNTVVNKIIPGGAAARDGRLKAGDTIVGVGQGGAGNIQDVVGMKLPDVVDQIRGKRGSMVRLKVVPAGQTAPVVYNVTRDKIQLEGARGATIEHRRAEAKTFKIGYVTLPSFYRDQVAANAGQSDYRSSTNDVRKLLQGFQAAGVDAVVIDLRTNGGGTLTEAIGVPDLFLAGGSIVRVKGPTGKIDEYSAKKEGTAWNGPLVVLTSRYTSSGAEIFTGAIQDHARGLIVGDQTTNGHGVVGHLFDLGAQLFGNTDPPKLGAAKITISQFYRPSGDSVQLRGVLADVELPSLINEMEAGQKYLDYPAEFDRIKPAAVEGAGSPIDDALRKQLRARSELRRRQSEGFEQLGERIALYHQRKNRKHVSLNREKFLAERSATAGNGGEQTTGPQDAVVKRDYFLDEVLEIALDYLSRARLAEANKIYGKGQYEQSLAKFEDATEADPDFAQAHYKLAWVLTTCPKAEIRDGERAVRHATRGCDLSDWQQWHHIFALSLAAAEAGNFDDAKKWLTKSLEMAPPQQRELYQFLRKRFESGESYPLK